MYSITKKQSHSDHKSVSPRIFGNLATISMLYHFSCCQCCYVQGDTSGQGLHFVDSDLIWYFRWLPNSERSKFAWHVGKEAELPYQSTK